MATIGAARRAGTGDRPPDPSDAESDPRVDVGRYRRMYLMVLAVWVAAPFLLLGQGAQDGVTLLVGGDLVGTDAGEVYQTTHEAARHSDAYVASFCELHPESDECRSLVLAFSSPPQALPLYAAAQILPPTAAILVVRLVAALCLVGGMLLVWRRVVTCHPDAPKSLVLTALLLTPFAGTPIALGQNTPVLFLVACLGLTATGRPARMAALAVLWPVAVAFKAFPALLGGVVLWQRRWRLLAWSAVVAGVLSAAAWWLGGGALFGDYLRQTGENGAERIDADVNGSLTAVLRAVGGDSAAWSLLPLVLLVPLAWLTLRIRDADSQWAFAGAAILVGLPLVTDHYLWLAFAAVAVVLGESDRSRPQLLALPAVAAALGGYAVMETIVGPIRWWIFAALAAAVALAFSLAATDGRPRRPVSAT